MYSGHQVYDIPLRGGRLLTLPNFETKCPDYPMVDRVEVSSPDIRNISVKVVFADIGSIEAADSIARVIASQVADRLAFRYKLSADDPIKGASKFTSKDAIGGPATMVAQGLSLTTSAHLTLEVSKAEVPQLKADTESVPARREPYLSQFRWILRQDDPVARFMHLYKILLSLEGGTQHTQGQVDKFIKSQEPSVKIVHNSHLNKSETIYTRLRNEVGHEIAGTTPASTRADMEQQIDKMTDHVKAAIAKLT